MPTRFTGPLVNQTLNRGTREWFSEMPLDGNPDFVKVYDDFFDDPASTNNPRWTVVKDTGASVALGTDVNNGAVKFSSAATTDNDGASIQFTQECMKPAADKKIWFETKFQDSDADQTDVFCGMSENFATDPENVLGDIARIGFQINDGDASIIAVCQSGSASATTTDTGVDLADNTDVTVGFRVDGTGQVKYFVNRSWVATHTTNVPTTEMAPCLFHLSGDAVGTRTSQWDYIWACKTR